MTDRPAPPPVPPGWERQRLVRLIDAAGGAVAWVSPEDGGNTVAFALWSDDRWRQMLFVEGPEALRARPTRYGCPVLFPFPGYAVDARYRWLGIERRLPVNAPDGRSHVHGFAHDRAWRVMDAQDDGVTLEFGTSDSLTAAEPSAYPFDVVVRQVVTLSAGELRINLEATNRGDAAAPVGLGLHPYLDPSFFDTDRSDLVVRLPGRWERVMEGPVATGNLQPAFAGTRNVGDVDRLICQTGLADPAVVSVAGPDGCTVEMELRGDWSDVALFVPPDQPSVSIEPLTCALSAASQDSASPTALPALAPGDSVVASVRVRPAI